MPISFPKPDYDSIRSALVQKLKERPEYIDADFDGSMLSAIVDLLAYNTTMNAFYLNQVGGEAFLSTASQQDSVIALAQNFGYVVPSAKSAQALIELTLTFSVDPGTPTYTLPKNLVFSASVGSQSFTFRLHPSPTQNDILTRVSTGVYRGEVMIYEGRQLTHKFPSFGDYVEIPNKMVDKSLLVGSLKNSGGSHLAYLSFVDGIPSSSVGYYAWTLIGKNGLVRILPDKSSFGQVYSTTNGVDITYVISSGETVNGIGAFSLTNPPSNTTPAIAVISAANGGASMESIEEIRRNAPLFFQTQGRAVTTNDYAALLKIVYPAAEAVSVISGADMNPPVYGSVFLAVQPRNGYYLTNTIKQRIQNDLKAKYAVGSVSPVVVDPSYLSASISMDIRIEPGVSEGEAQTAFTNALASFLSENKFTFGTGFSFSDFVRFSQTYVTGVRHITPTFVLRKSVPVASGAVQSLSVKFGNPIKPGSLSSDDFTQNGIVCNLTDDGQGNIILVNKTASTTTQIGGSVDYINGTVTVNDVFILASLSTETTPSNYTALGFVATSSAYDVFCQSDTILKPTASTITVSYA